MEDSKGRLASSPSKFARFYCAYGGSTVCDCKFMLNDSDEPRYKAENFCGCPEMHMASRLIATMTDREFERLCERAGVDL